MIARTAEHGGIELSSADCLALPRRSRLSPFPTFGGAQRYTFQRYTFQRYTFQRYTFQIIALDQYANVTCITIELS